MDNTAQASSSFQTNSVLNPPVPNGNLSAQNSMPSPVLESADVAQQSQSPIQDQTRKQDIQADNQDAASQSQKTSQDQSRLEPPTEFLQRDVVIKTYNEVFAEYAEFMQPYEDRFIREESLTTEEKKWLIDFRIARVGRNNLVGQDKPLRSNIRKDAYEIQLTDEEHGNLQITERPSIEGLLRFLDDRILTLEKTIPSFKSIPEVLGGIKRKISDYKKEKEILLLNSKTFAELHAEDNPDLIDARKKLEAYLIAHDPLRGLYQKENPTFTIDELFRQRLEIVLPIQEKTFDLRMAVRMRKLIATQFAQGEQVTKIIAGAIAFECGKHDGSVIPIEIPKPVDEISQELGENEAEVPDRVSQSPIEAHRYDSPSFDGWVKHQIARYQNKHIVEREKLDGAPVAPGDDELISTIDEFLQKYPKAYGKIRKKLYEGLVSNNSDLTLKGVVHGQPYDPNMQYVFEAHFFNSLPIAPIIKEILQEEEQVQAVQQATA